MNEVITVPLDTMREMLEIISNRNNEIAALKASLADMNSIANDNYREIERLNRELSNLVSNYDKGMHDSLIQKDKLAKTLGRVIYSHASTNQSYGDIMDEIKGHRKLQAVKALREYFPELGLRECKYAVDEMYNLEFPATD